MADAISTATVRPTKEKNCRRCNATFVIELRRGTNKQLYCSKRCCEQGRLEFLKSRKDLLSRCSTPDCGKPANRNRGRLCEACYCRHRRTGSTDRRPILLRSRRVTGYVILYGLEHPLLTASGALYEHRKVLYDTIGPGPHPCFWCGYQLEWQAIVVDHLNDCKDDNRPANLLVSCSRCNRARGSMLPFLKRMRPEAFPRFTEWAEALASTPQSTPAGQGSPPLQVSRPPGHPGHQSRIGGWANLYGATP